MTLPFRKMHGAGNDFVVIDARRDAFPLTGAQARRIADRHTGVGCDQLVVIELSDKADAFMRLYNADGGEVSTCGNASRCVAWLLMRELQRDKVSIETLAGVLAAERAGEALIKVDMGEPKIEWRDIPLSESRNTLHLGIAEGGLQDPVAVSMGNPHAVAFVNNLSSVRMQEWGSVLEHHPVFPERANISAAQIINRTRIKAVVWERGAGLTQACGSAACAIVVAAVRRGLSERRVAVELPGGELNIHWHDTGDASPNHVWMTGPVASSFEGSFPRSLLA